MVCYINILLRATCFGDIFKFGLWMYIDVSVWIWRPGGRASHTSQP
uniref:Uncharacterized protein n=1 Tax=Arundo donax TaxID=35708 RepID=A0A0A9EKV8_ARUDO